MISNLIEEKNIINSIISSSLKEILHRGLRVSHKSLGSLEDDIKLLLRALQTKNRIYDYVVTIDYNHLLKLYEGKIIYSLVNTENMGDKASDFEEELNFTF